MNLSISNIAWTAEQDNNVYAIMNQYGFTGLEIAPTRIFPELPYENLKEAKIWAENLKEKYGFSISSMQSIWYGRPEKLFGDVGERELLLNYTKQAIDFAEIIGCKNLVFGCPKNRFLPKGVDENIAVEFFETLAEYAKFHKTVLSMEANPTIYNTNYINATKEAIQLVTKLDLPGFLVNLDIGTMIENKEDISLLQGNVKWLNHVHISEPQLKMIEKRELHKELAELLRKENYQGFISIEMGKQDSIETIEEICAYVKEVFG